MPARKSWRRFWLWEKEKSRYMKPTEGKFINTSDGLRSGEKNLRKPQETSNYSSMQGALPWGEERRWGLMEKRILITVLAVVVGVAVVGGVWAQNAPETFSGTITKVDWVNKEFVVKNTGSQMIFQWNDETQVSRPSAENAALDSKVLKEGMTVTVFYKGRNAKIIANRIDVEQGKLTTLKGFALPFDCGAHVC
jgi:hypothetical protein